ncbi:MAG: hypothetical protein IPJ37_02945 [Bacteroidales bacterium]|nr:hypothetical protein [Bacteroidales bacterium]
MFENAVTVSNATISGLQINTAGTYLASDLTALKAWYSADASFNAGSDILLSTKDAALDAGLQIFPGWVNQVISSGTSGYIFITADVACGVTGRTINVSAVTPSDVSFVIGVPTGSTFAGGVQTIDYATPVNLTAYAAAGIGQSVLTWSAPSGCYSQVMIVVKAGVSVTGTPTGDSSAYSGNNLFGSGTPFRRRLCGLPGAPLHPRL